MGSNRRGLEARLRSAGSVLLLLGVAIVFSAGAAEIMVRLLVGEQVKFPRHVVGSSFGVRINQPNASYRHRSPDGTVWFKINSQGMRADTDYAYQKPDDVKRIVSLGDSFTVGYEVDAQQTFSSVLERSLQDRGLNVQVLNAGVSGYSNAEALLYLKRELLRYEPDLVLISFFSNDLVDNVRSGLFALEDGEFVQTSESYVPAGGLGNFLNTNPLFNFLSGYSDAFALVKERATTLMKQQAVAANLENLDQGSPRGRENAQSSPASLSSDYDRRLAAAIFEEMLAVTSDKGISLVIQSIPVELRDPPRLVDPFPLEFFDVNREGLAYFSAADVLQPHLERGELLYNQHSHFHWTPFSHEQAGRALAERIAARRLLEPRANGGS